MKYEERAAFEQADSFEIGAPNDAYAQYFVGDSFLHPLTDPKECPVLWQMSHLSRDAGITGIFITQTKVVDRSLSVPPARVYIRSGAKSRRFCIRGMWYILNRV